MAAGHELRRELDPPGKPWHNGFVEISTGRLRDECLNREWFRDLREARAVLENWRQLYNHLRPHSALGYRPPASCGRIVQWGFGISLIGYKFGTQARATHPAYLNDRSENSIMQ